MATLLFCEDEARIRKLIGATLGRAHEVHIAENGEIGLRLARKIQPAAIFTDVNMPVMGGFALATAIRGDSFLRLTPVVFITASAQRLEIEAYRTLGVTTYLLKPFGAEELRATVERALKLAVAMG